MLHLKAGPLPNALWQASQQRHRIISQLPAREAKQVRVLAAPVNVLVDKTAFIDGNALQHTAIGKQIKRAVDRGARYPLTSMMQPEEQIVRGEVAMQRLDEVEDEFPLARAARSGR
ncbi:MAG: hypothetical protein WBD87_01080 [Candidatus Acidiferrales bacterium]